MKMMSLRFGCSDAARSRAFYDATFAAIGGPASSTPEGSPMLLYRLPGGPVLLLGAARNGEPVSPANGGTVLFAADSAEDVHAWHAAGMANGGTCEGPPEPKPQTGGKVGAYLRDPDGNKLGIFYDLNLG